jgi:hypothetical protein
MVTISVTLQRQLLDCLRDLKVGKHHNLDICTLKKIDELIDLLETAQSGSVDSTQVDFDAILKVARIIERLPSYLELLAKVLGN